MKQTEFLGLNLPEETDPVDIGILSENFSTVDVQMSAGGGIPPGCILIWSGAEADIPPGYALCDGTDNTPDLRDRFVLGAGLSYAVDATGGEKSHTLTVSEMPRHSHSVTLNGGSGTNLFSAGASNFSGGSASTNVSGSGAAHNNMPPYYALCYIIKL